MPRRHRAQLAICHQRIGVDLSSRFCDLRAYAWCFDCDHYVCDIHLVSRHLRHSIEVEFPAARPS